MSYLDSILADDSWKHQPQRLTSREVLSTDSKFVDQRSFSGLDSVMDELSDFHMTALEDRSNPENIYIHDSSARWKLVTGLAHVDVDEDGVARPYGDVYVPVAAQPNHFTGDNKSSVMFGEPGFVCVDLGSRNTEFDLAYRYEIGGETYVPALSEVPYSEHPSENNSIRVLDMKLGDEYKVLPPEQTTTIDSMSLTTAQNKYLAQHDAVTMSGPVLDDASLHGVNVYGLTFGVPSDATPFNNGTNNIKEQLSEHFEKLENQRSNQASVGDLKDEFKTPDIKTTIDYNMELDV